MTNYQTKLPNIVYYNDDHIKSPTCTGELSEINGATWTLPNTWKELSLEIEHGEDKIVFHIDMITKSNENIQDFIKSIQTIAKFIPGHKPLKIVVLITPNTTQQQVKELKDSKILGIGYDVTYYSYEQAAEATKALIEGTPHWPEHIISQLPAGKSKPISVYFRKGWHDYYQAYGESKMIGTLVKNPELPWESKMCDTWDELGDVLRLNPHQIIFHVSMITEINITVSEFVDMIRTLNKAILGHKIPLAIGIEKDTPLSMIKEFQRCDLFGIVPSASSFGINETCNGIDALFNRIPYWPKHIIEQLPGNVKKVKTESTVDLTPRQYDVLNLIKERGASNKVIAKLLRISESTVKLHVGAILKKYNLKNRTQLALFTEK